jgi:hypothetical protein
VVPAQAEEAVGQARDLGVQLDDGDAGVGVALGDPPRQGVRPAAQEEVVGAARRGRFAIQLSAAAM